MKHSEYKGYQIHVTEGGLFQAWEGEDTEGEPRKSAYQLSDLTQALDGLVAHLVAGALVIMERTFEEGKITSVAGTDYKGHVEYRVRSGKRWGNYTAGALFKTTPENKALIAEIKALREQERELTRQQYAKQDLLEHCTDADFLASPNTQKEA